MVGLRGSSLEMWQAILAEDVEEKDSTVTDSEAALRELSFSTGATTAVSSEVSLITPNADVTQALGIEPLPATLKSLDDIIGGTCVVDFTTPSGGSLQKAIETISSKADESSLLRNPFFDEVEIGPFISTITEQENININIYNLKTLFYSIKRCHSKIYRCSYFSLCIVYYRVNTFFC